MSHQITQDQEERLVQAALAGLSRSYAPYSHFHVSAALLCGDGTIYTGNNIENAAYSATVCAERCAFFQAVGAGKAGFCGYRCLRREGWRGGGFLPALRGLPPGDAGVLRPGFPDPSGEGKWGAKVVHIGGAAAGELWAGSSGVMEDLAHGPMRGGYAHAHV